MRSAMGVGALLILHLAILVHSASWKSATVDELSHLMAGLVSYTTLDFRLHHDAPPLQSVMCAAMAWHSGGPVHVPLDNENWNKGIWNGAGDRLVESNPESFHDVLQRARLASMVLSVCVCLCVYLFSRWLWGEWPAMIVLGFTVLEPNLLAHGRLVTTDTATTLGFILVGMMTWRYLHRRCWLWLIAAGTAFGVMWLNKHSAVVVLPSFVVIDWLCQFHENHEEAISFSHRFRTGLRFAVRSMMRMLVIAGAGLLTIWAGFAFEVGNSIENASPTGSALWQELQVPVRSVLYFVGFNGLAGFDPSDASNPLWQAISGWLPAYSHWEAFSANRMHLRSGHLGYLMGQYSTTGFMAFYPVLFLVKTPVIALGLILYGGFMLSRQSVIGVKDRLILVFPLIALLVLVLLNTASIGYRHVLPLVPYLLVFAGGAASYSVVQWIKNPTRRMLRIGVVITIFGVYAASVLWQHPHYLSFFNGLIGGPGNGHRYAVDSNLDWGQDLLMLKHYRETQGDEAYGLLYFGPTSLPAAYGVTSDPYRVEDHLHRPVLVVSASVLRGIGMRNLFPLLEPLRNRPPDEWITPALMLYRVRPGEIQL